MPAVFQIVSRVSGKALTIGPEVAPEFPLEIQQFPQNNEDPNQMWVLAPQGNGNFVIQPLGSPDQAIGLFDIPPDPSQSQPLALLSADSGQVWGIYPSPPYFFVFGTDYGMAMDLPSGSHNDGQLIQIFTQTDGENQQWTFVPVLSQLP